MAAASRSAYEQLGPQHRRFVDAYLECGFNATQAAAKAGYAHPETYGARVKKRPDVQAAITERLDELAMPAAEVLARLADIARGTLTDFIDVPDSEPEPPASAYRAGDRCPRCAKERPESVTVLERGTVTNLATGKTYEDLICLLCAADWRPQLQPEWTLNLSKAQRRGKLHLLAELGYTEHGPKFKLHDPLAALQLLGKHHKLFVERQELSGPDGGGIPLDLMAAAAKIYGDPDAESDEQPA